MKHKAPDRKPPSGTLSPATLDALLRLGVAAGNKFNTNEPPLELPLPKVEKDPPR